MDNSEFSKRQEVEPALYVQPQMPQMAQTPNIQNQQPQQYTQTSYLQYAPPPTQQQQNVIHYNTPYISQPLSGSNPIIQQYALPQQDYMVWSILNIFLCWVLAIPAIIFSCDAKSLNITGNFILAQSKAKMALIFNIIATVIGLIWIVTLIVVLTTVNRYNYYPYP